MTDHSVETNIELALGYWDSFRQLLQPREWRIAKPSLPFPMSPPAFSSSSETPVPEEVQPQRPEPTEETATPEDALAAERASLVRTYVEQANCVWYLWTRTYNWTWADEAVTADDPKSRQAMRALRRAIDALTEAGLEVKDIQGKRYPGEGEVILEHKQVKKGIQEPLVEEMIQPIIYLQDRLVQRGKVFVSAPATPDNEEVESAVSAGTASSPARPSAGENLAELPVEKPEAPDPVAPAKADSQKLPPNPSGEAQEKARKTKGLIGNAAESDSQDCEANQDSE